MGKVALYGIETYLLCGVTEIERKVGIKGEVSVELDLNLQNCQTDQDLEHSIDYGLIADIVKQITYLKEYRLLETIARLIGNELIQKFPHAEKLSVSVSKRRPLVSVLADRSTVVLEYPKDWK